MGPVSEPLYHNNSNSSQNGESESEGQQQNPTIKSPLNCPRCNSTNTKFCYYNNYSRLQPRHFCRSCRRHWTAGGTLRDVPFGGGRKYTKRRKMPENYNNNLAGAASASAETIMDTNLLFPPPPPLGDAAYLPHGSFSANDVESAFVGSMYDFVNVYDEVGPAWQLPETIPAGYWDEITDLM